VIVLSLLIIGEAMKKYLLDVLMISWEQIPLVKVYEVRAADLEMAVGMCKGQSAINGWKFLELKSYEVLN
jgi:hypothetical protein